MSKVTLKIEIDEEDFKSTEYATLLYSLNATPLTECDDCVNRQAVLDIAKSSKSNWIDNSVLFKRVNELAPVTPKREHGEWIKDDFTGLIKCSRCKNDAPISTVSGTQYESDFCQSCGAEMR